MKDKKVKDKVPKKTKGTNKKNSLAQKLMIPLAVATTLLFVSTLSNSLQLMDVKKQVANMGSTYFVTVSLAGEVKAGITETTQLFMEAALVKDKAAMEEAGAVNTTVREQIIRIQELNPDLAEHWQEVVDKYDDLYAAGKGMAETCIKSGVDAGMGAMLKTEALNDEALALVEEEVSESYALYTAAQAQSNTLVKLVQFQISLSGIVVFVVVVYVLLVVKKQVIAPIRKVTDALNGLAEKDLTTEEVLLKNKDELGVLANACNELRASMREVMVTLNSSSTDMDNSSSEMAKRSEDIAKNVQDITDAITNIATTAGEQAIDVEKTAGEIDELRQVIGRSEEASQQLSMASAEISAASQEGEKVVTNLHKITKESEAAFGGIFDSIAKINESTAKIGEASNMIESIASQTNLLSLNASIEAARAGEMGKGFAVVADEIRKLSEESASCVNEINQMLKELRNNVQYASEQSETVRNAVNMQVQGVEETSQKYSDIADSIVKINSEIQQLSEISKVMNESCVVVSEVVTNLSASAEENAASTEETNAAVQEVLAMVQEIAQGTGEIKDLSSGLQGQVKLYKLD